MQCVVPNALRCAQYPALSKCAALTALRAIRCVALNSLRYVQFFIVRHEAHNGHRSEWRSVYFAKRSSLRVTQRIAHYAADYAHCAAFRVMRFVACNALRWAIRFDLITLLRISRIQSVACFPQFRESLVKQAGELLSVLGSGFGLADVDLASGSETISKR